MVLAEVNEANITEAAEQPRLELAWSRLQEYRMRRYRSFAEGKVRTIEQAREFVDEMGFSFLFPAPGIEMPSLWQAINGKEREIPKHHHDHALTRAWDWKDSMPSRKWAWYGKLLKGKPMFVSLDMLPNFYALSENFGELDDYLQQFEDGKMSVEAKRVYETLLENGASSTNVLRKLSGLIGGPDPARRFERAINELQADFKIVKCGVSDDNRWKYCYVYDALLRLHPDLAEQARVISSREARKRILSRYLQNVGAAPADKMPTLFGWDKQLTRRTIDELLTEGVLQQVHITGAPLAKSKVPAKTTKKPAANKEPEPLLAISALLS